MNTPVQDDGPPVSSQRAFSRVLPGVVARPAVGDSIPPQWVVCPSSTFAATRSVSAAAACSANLTTLNSSVRSRTLHPITVRLNPAIDGEVLGRSFNPGPGGLPALARPVTGPRLT